MQMALSLKHPMDINTVLSDIFKRAVFKMLTVEAHVLSKQRLDMLKFYRERAEALQQQEDELHKSLAPHVQQEIEGKRFLLLEERLNAMSFPDMHVLNDFKNGVDLVGEEPFSYLFMEKLQPATMTVDQLETSAEWNKKLVMVRPHTEYE